MGKTVSTVEKSWRMMAFRAADTMFSPSIISPSRASWERDKELAQGGAEYCGRKMGNKEVPNSHLGQCSRAQFGGWR